MSFHPHSEFRESETLSRFRARSRTAALPTLRVLSTPGTRVSRSAPVAIGPSIRIGRAVQAPDLEIEDPCVSRVHAELRRRADGRIVIENKSTHGTYRNGMRLYEATLLEDGDVLRIGDSLIIFRLTPIRVRSGRPIDGMIGDAPGVHRVRADVEEVAPTDATVLVLGASGTGKELVARAIHASSGRVGPFVAVNCAAIADSLADSLLFGHVSGAFTGARRDEPGLLRAANGGTLFLDEVGELAPAIQAKLLRVLEQREIMAVGSTRAISIDVRIVAATHRDLGNDVGSGQFRGDLHARLAEIVLRLPTLSARREDVLPILQYALGHSRISADLAELLVLHDWPYNVRELLKIARQLQVRGASYDVLEPDAIADRLLRGEVLCPPEPEEAKTEPPPRRSDVPPSREEIESAMRAHGGNIADAARALRRSRRQIYRYLEQYGLARDVD